MNENHIKKLTHVTLKCNDFGKMCDFYKNIMCFEEAFSIPFNAAQADRYAADAVKEGDTWLTYFKIAPTEFVELFNTKYGTDHPIPECSFMHFSVLVEDIKEAARHFESKGVQLWAGPRYVNHPWLEPYPANRKGECGSYAFYIQDPEGNEIEVMQYTKDSKQLNLDTEE